MLVGRSPCIIQTHRHNGETADVSSLLTLKKSSRHPHVGTDTVHRKVVDPVTKGLYSSLKHVAAMVENSFTLEKTWNSSDGCPSKVPVKEVWFDCATLYDDVYPPTIRQVPLGFSASVPNCYLS